ncbi:MAG: WD40 repeat domain-containing protein [Candidatus Marsarchaeota archaeon]|nr:WD40 repeat domain-containing protein [Candidatus Marsarchaeota archaeon]
MTATVSEEQQTMTSTWTQSRFDRLVRAMAIAGPLLSLLAVPPSLAKERPNVPVARLKAPMREWSVPGMVTSMNLCAGGRKLVVVWDPDSSEHETGSVVSVFDTQTSAATRVVLNGEIDPTAVSPNGKTLVGNLESADGLRVWGARTGEVKAVLTLDVNSPYKLYGNPGAFSPDGRMLAVSGVEKEGEPVSPYKRGKPKAVAIIYDTRTWRQIRVLPFFDDGFLEFIAFSPDSALIAAAGGWNGDVVLRDVNTGRQIRAFTGVHFLPDAPASAAHDSWGNALQTLGRLMKSRELLLFLSDGIVVGGTDVVNARNPQSRPRNMFGSSKRFRWLAGSYGDRQVLYGVDKTDRLESWDAGSRTLKRIWLVPGLTRDVVLPGIGRYHFNKTYLVCASDRLLAVASFDFASQRTKSKVTLWRLE